MRLFLCCMLIWAAVAAHAESGGRCTIENRNPDFSSESQDRKPTTDCGMLESDFDTSGLDLLLAQALPPATRQSSSTAKSENRAAKRVPASSPAAAAPAQKAEAKN